MISGMVVFTSSSVKKEKKRRDNLAVRAVAPSQMQEGGGKMRNARH